MALFSASPYWTNASTAPAFWEATAKVATLATAYQTNSAFSLFHRTCDTGCAQVSHYMAYDAGIYILAGNATVNVEGLGEDTPLGAGDYVVIPPYTTVSYVAANDTTVLEFYTPGGVEGLVSGLWQPAFPGQSTPVKQAPAPATYASFLDSQYGAVFFPPKSTASPASPADQAAVAAVMESPSAGMTNATAAPAFWVQPGVPELWTVLAGSRQTGNAYTLTQKVYGKGAAITPSRYTKTDFSYYVLKGNASLLIDNQVVALSEDQFVFVPKGTMFALTTSEDFTALVFDVPGGMAERSLSLFDAVPAKERRLPSAEEVSAANLTNPRVSLEMKMSMGVVSLDLAAASEFK